MTDTRRALTLRARRSLAGLASLLALALLLSAGTGLARADTLFNESFTGATTASSGFSVGATAPAAARFKQVCLTASTNTAQTPIPGCTAGQAAIPAGGDPAGSGALRFTNNEGNLAGFLLSDDPLPLTAGLDVSFDYYSYDKTSGTPADGLSFFLVNGTTTLTSPGAVGGSLGYAQNTTTPGVAGGYLGVGLDEYGNYTNNSQGKGAGCAGEPLSGGLAANLVGVRGPGNGLAGILPAGEVRCHRPAAGGRHRHLAHRRRRAEGGRDQGRPAVQSQPADHRADQRRPGAADARAAQPASDVQVRLRRLDRRGQRHPRDPERQHQHGQRAAQAHADEHPERHPGPGWERHLHAAGPDRSDRGDRGPAGHDHRHAPRGR